MKDFILNNRGKTVWMFFCILGCLAVQNQPNATVQMAAFLGWAFGVPFVLYKCEQHNLGHKWVWAVCSFIFPWVAPFVFALVMGGKIQKSQVSSKSSDDEDLEKEIGSDPVKENYLVSLLEGTRPTVLNAETMPFVWPENDFLLFSIRTEAFGIKKGRKYVAGSRGASIRVAKGLSFRVGNARGHSESVDTKDDYGKSALIAITNKSVFVQATNGTVKQWSRNSINSINAFKDGIRMDFNKGIPLVIRLNSLFDVACARQAALFREKA